MSVRQTNALWQRYEIEPRRMHLLHAICDCADDDGRAFPSVNYLGWKTGIPRSTVLLYLKEFRALGVIKNLGRRANVESGVEKYSGRDTSVVMVHLENLPLKKAWREIRRGSPGADLGSSSSGATVVQLRDVGSPAARELLKEETSGIVINQTTPLSPPKKPEGNRALKIPTRKNHHLRIDQAIRALASEQPEAEPRVIIRQAALKLGFDPQYVAYQPRAGSCPFHPNSGATQLNTCWACYTSEGMSIEPQGTPSKAAMRITHNRAAIIAGLSAYIRKRDQA